MMSSGGVAVESTNNGNEGNKRMPCPLYGCKRVYTDTNSLQSHIKDHEIPAQSLPGKTMMCSFIGCSCSFPNMQKLMEHMRHHHKPNVYFLCESCHAKLRSYRGLLHHLRSCSKVPRSKLNPAPSASAAVPMAVDPNPTATQEDALSTPPQLPPVPLQSDQASQLSSNHDLAPPHLIAQQLIESTVQSVFRDNNPQVAPTLNLEVQPGPKTNEVQVQQRPKTPENQSQPKFTPQTPPANIWRSGQGLTPERRILWQHTRGRYTCVQCKHTVTNRKEMTEHSSTHHSDNFDPKEETATNPATTNA